MWSMSFGLGMTGGAECVGWTRYPTTLPLLLSPMMLMLILDLFFSFHVYTCCDASLMIVFDSPVIHRYLPTHDLI